MESFKVTLLDKQALARYPSSSSFISAISSLESSEINPYLRFHLLEGVPFFLRCYPLVYELSREWLSDKLSIDPRAIFVIGSSSIGFSMAPPPSFGRSYTNNSDIDLSIISETLFSELKLTFTKWKQMYESGETVPQNSNETKYWKENLIRVPKNIESGFIDTYKIPNRYDASKRVNNALFEFSEKIRLTINPNNKLKVGARVYKDWKCFNKQYMINFQCTLQKLRSVGAISSVGQE